MDEVLKVGIVSRKQLRILDAAAGRAKLNKDDPKIWLSSTKSLDQSLNDNNDRLFKLPNS